jgi:CO dehydrogenase/acetyl-CoA synthase beta subunit
MGLFDKQLMEVRGFLDRAAAGRECREYVHDGPVAWPSGMRKSVVLSQDMAVELGSPRLESSSFLLWHDDPSAVRDGSIRLVGPELSGCAGMSLPFGKIVIIGVSGFNEENGYERYRELDGVRYDLDLRGYMMRAVSQHQREWSRVSREALGNGFSFRVLGGALIDAYRKIDYVRSVEIIFVTSSTEDVRELQPVSESAVKITSAMSKMLQELDYDCSSCAHTDVCGDVADLRKMRDTLTKKGELRYAN